MTSIPEGQYSILVHDLGTIHNFHLQGTGVDQMTSIPGTGDVTWEVTFVPGTYTFQCDAHSFSMNGSFMVTGGPLRLRRHLRRHRLRLRHPSAASATASATATSATASATSASATASAASATATATTATSATTAAPAATTASATATDGALPGAEGDRAVARKGEDEDPPGALLRRQHPPGSFDGESAA